MGVILVDLAHRESPSKDDLISVNWWNWRPTIEIIRSLRLLDDDTLERMGYNAAGAKVTEEQARKIGEHLRSTVIPTMTPDARIQLNLEPTTTPDDFKMHYGNGVEKNYSATYAWLQQFAAFCLTCKGFSVG